MILIRWELGVSIDVSVVFPGEETYCVHIGLRVPEEHWLYRCIPEDSEKNTSIIAVLDFAKRNGAQEPLLYKSTM